MKTSVGLKIGAGFGLALLVLVVIGAVSFLSTRDLVEASHRVSRTHEVLAGAERLMSMMKDAETGQRGFLLTGDEEYLEPYLNAIKVIPPQLEGLRTLTRDQPDQQTQWMHLPAVRATTRPPNVR